MKLFTYIFRNTVFATMLYLGLHEGSQGALNVAIFFVWFSFVASWAMTQESVIAEAIKVNKKPSVPRWVDGAFDFCVLCSLIWYGWIIAGIAYLIHSLLLQDFWSKVLKKEVA